MKILITGSLGLVGSEAVKYYLTNNATVIGVDNNMRKHFFGKEASVLKNKIDHRSYTHYGIDISKTENLIKEEKPDVIIHCAAQPSHDYSAQEPLIDFGINAYSTLMLLEFVRNHCPHCIFVYTSTNKVYGDWPNHFGYKETDTRFVPTDDSPIKNGVHEMFPIENCMHSPFGVSKLAGDLYCQEYARYFNIRTGIFRCGCVTGAAHAGAKLHGFLSYMVRCKKEKKEYTVYGYQGKQVRDQIHASDLVRAMDCFVREPKMGQIYNMGGGNHCNISVIEALNWLKMKNWAYESEPRRGDHKWYVSDISKFKKDYPEWDYQYNTWSIMEDLMA